MTKLSDTDIPKLDGGWINFTEAAERLGYTRSYMYKKASAGGFETLRRLGDQPTYVLNESEIEKILAGRELITLVAEEKPSTKPRAPRKSKSVIDEQLPPDILAELELGIKQSAAGEVVELSLDELLEQL